MPRAILDDAYFHAVLDGPVLRAVRSSAPFATLGDVARVHRDVAEAFEALPRARLGLCLDLRAAPSRNDEGFEAAMAPYRARMMRDWARVAVVVRSVVGGMQVQRHARGDATPVHVFDDPDAALAFAAGVEARP